MGKADYFIRRGDKQRGPMTSAAVRESASTGNLSTDDAIRRGDTGDWIRAADIPGLFDTTTESTDAELIEDPFVNLARRAAGAVRTAIRTFAITAVQLATAAKRAVTSRPKRSPGPTVAPLPPSSHQRTTQMPNINCQNCNATINVPPSKAGPTITCPACKMQTKTIPASISPRQVPTPAPIPPQLGPQGQQPLSPTFNADVLACLESIDRHLEGISRKVRDFHTVLIILVLLVFLGAVGLSMKVAGN